MSAGAAAAGLRARTYWLQKHPTPRDASTDWKWFPARPEAMPSEALVELERGGAELALALETDRWVLSRRFSARAPGERRLYSGYVVQVLAGDPVTLHRGGAGVLARVASRVSVAPHAQPDVLHEDRAAAPVDETLVAMTPEDVGMRAPPAALRTMAPAAVRQLAEAVCFGGAIDAAALDPAASIPVLCAALSWVPLRACPERTVRIGAQPAPRAPARDIDATAAWYLAACWQAGAGADAWSCLRDWAETRTTSLSDQFAALAEATRAFDPRQPDRQRDHLIARGLVPAGHRWGRVGLAPGGAAPRARVPINLVMLEWCRGRLAAREPLAMHHPAERLVETVEASAIVDLLNWATTDASGRTEFSRDRYLGPLSFALVCTSCAEQLHRALAQLSPTLSRLALDTRCARGQRSPFMEDERTLEEQLARVRQHFFDLLAAVETSLRESEEERDAVGAQLATTRVDAERTLAEASEAFRARIQQLETDLKDVASKLPKTIERQIGVRIDRIAETESAAIRTLRADAEDVARKLADARQESDQLRKLMRSLEDSLRSLGGEAKAFQKSAARGAARESLASRSVSLARDEPAVEGVAREVRDLAREVGALRRELAAATHDAHGAPEPWAVPEKTRAPTAVPPDPAAAHARSWPRPAGAHLAGRGATQRSGDASFDWVGFGMAQLVEPRRIALVIALVIVFGAGMWIGSLRGSAPAAPSAAAEPDATASPPREADVATPATRSEAARAPVAAAGGDGSAAAPPAAARAAESPAAPVSAAACPDGSSSDPACARPASPGGAHAAATRCTALDLSVASLRISDGASPAEALVQRCMRACRPGIAADGFIGDGTLRAWKACAEADPVYDAIRALARDQRLASLACALPEPLGAPDSGRYTVTVDWLMACAGSAEPR